VPIADIVQQVKSLSRDEQKVLVKELIDLLTDDPAPKSKHSLRESRGLGAHLYDGARHSGASGDVAP
jgi:hypothetical protein